MSTEEAFVPELHDAGKLIDHRAGVVKALSREGTVEATRGGHVFERIAWEQHGLKAPTTASWLGVRHHHLAALRDDKLPFADVREAFREADAAEPLPPADEATRFKRRVLLSLADNVAASQSRILEPGGLPQGEQTDVRVKLWSMGFHNAYLEHWSPISDEAAWKRFVGVMSTPETDAKRFFKLYGQNLLLRAEDAKAPRNLTSLYTHVRLVGQIYRILDRFVTVEPNFKLRYGEVTANNKDEALAKWLFRLVRCEVQVLQSPVRAKDLHVFALLSQALAKMREDTGRADFLLYSTGQSLSLLLPGADVAGAPTLEEALAHYLETFAVFWKSYEIPLDEITPDLAGLTTRMETAEKLARGEMDRAVGEEKQNWNSVYSQILDKRRALEGMTQQSGALYPGEIGKEGGKELAPDLCEICQLRHSPGEHQHETRYGGVEYLCVACDDIRTSADGHRLRTIAQWEGAGEPGENGKAERMKGRLAWVRVSLDVDVLLSAIQTRLGDFLGRLKIETAKQQRAVEIAKANFRPTAVIADFIDDYVGLLAELETWVKGRYGRGEKNIEEWQLISRQVSSTGVAGADFFVLRLDRGREVYDLVEQYWVLLQEHFPDMVSPCPIRLAVNVAPAKYPFYEHWRDLTQADREVWLNTPGRRLVRMAARHLDTFLDLTGPAMEGRSHYLHRLAALEARAGGSSSLADLTFQHDLRTERHKMTRELEDFAKLMRSDKEISVGQLLGWYRLVTWGRE